MFVLINIWRIASHLRWAINPYVASLVIRSSVLSLIQTGHATLKCRFFRVGKTPSDCISAVIGMKFNFTLGRKPLASYDFIVWITQVLD